MLQTVANELTAPLAALEMLLSLLIDNSREASSRL